MHIFPFFLSCEVRGSWWTIAKLLSQSTPAAYHLAVERTRVTRWEELKRCARVYETVEPLTNTGHTLPCTYYIIFIYFILFYFILF